MYTLLMADDEQLERQALRFIIERDCPEIHIVGETGNGASAVCIASSEKPDIVLMDIRMPELNGLEAARMIRTSLPDTTIVMLTAFDEFNYAKQALSIGAAEYLLKPLRPEDLVRTLRSILEKVRRLKSKQQEEVRLRKSLQEAMPFIQMSFVYDLISGNITNLEHCKERSCFLGMNTEPGVVMVIDIDNCERIAHSKPELKKQMVKQEIYRYICDIVDENALVTPYGGDGIIVLLDKREAGTPEDVKTAVQTTAECIRAGVARQTGIHVAISIGRYYDDPRDIYKSYHEALIAQRQRFYLGTNQIIHIDDVLHLNDGPFPYPFHHERAVLDKVRCGDRKQAKESLRQLLHEIFFTKASIETVKACVLELLIVLSRSAVEGGANLDQLTLLNFSCISQLMECSSREEVHDWMLDALERFMDNMLENRNSMNVRVVNKACDYITKNCHKNISLEEVAQSVHLSSFYFSRLFKQKQGCNFVEFLTKARIDKAKHMLQNPDQTVVRTAVETGYQDASYFCRVFRQEVGMTPTQYRNEIRNGKFAGS